MLATSPLLYGLPSLFTPGTSGFLFSSMMPTIMLQTAGGTPVSADGNPVGQFLDQSGLGNNAAQVTSTKRPLWHPNSGKPYIRTDGVDDYMATTWTPGATGMIAAACRIAAASGYAMGCRSRTGDRVYMNLNASGYFGGAIGATAYLAANVDKRGVDCAGVISWNASFVTVWLDGTKYTPLARSGTVNPGYPMGLCSLNNAGVFGICDTMLYSAIGLSYEPSDDIISNLITPALRSTYS